MEERYAKFIELIKEVRINIPLVDVLAGMPNYRKFLKDLMSNKSKMEQISVSFLNKECSAIVQNKLPPKLGDHRSFLIPCTVVGSVEYLALVDLGASINLMPYLLYVSLSGNTLKPTRMSICLANHTYEYLMRIEENMLEDDKVPLILGRPFLHTADAIIQVKNKELNLGVGDGRITFLIDKVMRHSHSNDDTCFCVDVIDELIEEEFDALLDDSKPFSTTSEKINKSFLDHEFKEFMAVEIEEIHEQEEEFENSFKSISNMLFWKKDSLLPVVISALLQDDEKKHLVLVLKKHKEAFAWKTSDILGISPSFCKHKINFKDDTKPVIQRQRRLNPNMKEVMKKEIIKLLDAGIIYAIEDSPWVSPVHCIPKKGGMTVVTNEKNELVPTRTVTGWHVCIDYRKLNEATQKDHFSLPFMDQMLERLAGNKFICFLDRFSGYFQILIEPADQE
ncbi:reverse transcriptase domain-containing protein [Tanacetum coccineum]